MPLFRHGTLAHADYYGAAVSTADVDGDGRLDMITCSGLSPFAVSLRQGAYHPIWYGPSCGCNAVAAGDRNGDGSVEVVATSPAGTLSIFDTRSLGGGTTISLPGEPTDVAMANVDDDAALEIVVVGSAGTWVYDGRTLALQWDATGYGGGRVRIGDVDGDSRPEVVVNGSTAFVLDAVAQTEKWGYLGGFGGPWTLGNTDGDAKLEIVFRSGAIKILHADTFVTETMPYTPYYLDGLLVADGDGDGTTDIITAHYHVEGRNPVDGSVRWSIPTGYAGVARRMAVANVDDDPSPELIWAGAVYDYDSAPLAVCDAASGTIDYTSHQSQSPYTFASGDLDGDGTLEYVVAAGAAAPGDPLVQIFDPASGLSEGELSNAGVPSFSEVRVFGIGQVDADPALEIVGAAGSYLITWDAGTKLLEFKSSAPLVREAVVANVDGDPVDEIVITTISGLSVLDGATNIIQKSVAINGGARDLQLADLNGDLKDEVVVAAAHDLYVYETATWSVLGQQPFPNLQWVAATAADGGIVAGVSSYNVRVYRGGALTAAWSCSGGSSAYAGIAALGGEQYILVRDVNASGGAIRVYPAGADSCPTPLVRTIGSSSIYGLEASDATGDGRNELITMGYTSLQVALLGLATEPRGDVDGDGTVTTGDLDATADYLFGAGLGSSPSADANGDERIGVDDLFLLIHYELAGGAPPAP
ncbi:MAG TPA: hypothetical protein VGF28_10620 [Thermoanaerobaculia bacterium]